MAKKLTYEESEHRPKEVVTEAVECNRTERRQGESEESFLAKKSAAFIAGILILFGLYLSSLYSYLLFHSLAEIFSIVVACGIFIVAWNSRRIMDNNYLLFLGIAYLFIGVLDLVHTLGYRGMGIFHGYATNLPTQLWIAARYMESLSLLIAPLFLARRLKANLALMVYTLATFLVLGSVFYWHIFPTCFVEGVGLTAFKKTSEYIISIILLGAITLLFQKRKEFDERVFRLLVAAMAITIAAELAFTFYIHAYGFSNLVGHYFKIISFYLIYKAIIETGLTRPYTLLFRNLKQSEEALRESRDNLDKAQGTARVGSWSRDLKTNQGQWSDEMYRILGLTPGNPKQPFFETFLSRVHPDDREHTQSVIKEAVEKKGSFDFEFRIVPIDGSERIIHELGEVECDEAGTPVRIYGTDQDITETRRLQAQLHQSQKMEAIATLAGGIAHQFNNALNAITGYTGLLEIDYPQDEKIADYAEAMKQSALHMAHLTDLLLAYAEGGKYNPEILTLSELIEGSLPLIQHTLDPDIRVETDLPLDVLNVKADRTQMQMVLSAILTNSNEAIEPPGRIRISTKNIEVDQGSIKDHPGLKPGPYVCLSIEDNGKGMDQETKERIFEPFFTTHFIGRGLGMASVYGIIKNHDGTTTVDSEIGKGTVVRIYLPAIPSAQARRAGLPAIEAEEEVGEKVVSEPKVELAMGEGTVLVIEDEEPLVELFRQILERLGYRVLQARTGEEAVETAKTFDGRIDLALLDIKLPDMSGNQVYPLIMETRPNLKVIVCSGYSIDSPAQEILDAGAQGFIQKPFSLKILAEKLKEVLEG